MGADVRGLCVCECATQHSGGCQRTIRSYNEGPGTRDFTQWTILLIQQNILKWWFKKYCVHMFMTYVSKCECHRMYVEVHRRLHLLSTSVMGSRDQTEVIRRLYTRWTSSPGPQQDFMWHVLSLWWVDFTFKEQHSWKSLQAADFGILEFNNLCPTSFFFPFLVRELTSLTCS